MEKVTGQQYAEQALSSKYDNLKYSQYDCQAFVELVLRDCGVRTASGAVYNWKGSNDMWRNALKWRGTLDECIQTFGCIPAGAWVFMVKHDGGEIPRGYHDDEGNASHVGIYCRPESTKSVRDSTKGTNRDGVGYRPVTDFTHVGIPCVLYFGDQSDPEPEIPSVTKEEALQALETLTKFVKG
jgi:hypothetical protein